jgi:hypothetical protein
MAWSLTALCRELCGGRQSFQALHLPVPSCPDLDSDATHSLRFILLDSWSSPRRRPRLFIRDGGGLGSSARSLRPSHLDDGPNYPGVFWCEERGDPPSHSRFYLVCEMK